MSAHLTLVTQPEQRVQAVARRLREQIAGRRINVGRVADQLGVSRMWMSRRTTGQTPLSVDDLEMIEDATGISADYLFTGHGSPSSPLDPEKARPKGFEPPTF